MDRGQVAKLLRLLGHVPPGVDAGGNPHDRGAGGCREPKGKARIDDRGIDKEQLSARRGPERRQAGWILTSLAEPVAFGSSDAERSFRQL